MTIKLSRWTIEFVAQIKVGRFGYPGMPFWGYERFDYDMVAYRSIGFWIFSICWYKHWEDQL